MRTLQRNLLGTLVLGLLAATSLAQETKPAGKAMGIEKTSFGTHEGKDIHLYTCTNSNGLVIKLTNYGAHVVEMWTPDRDGKNANITLGFDKLDGYVKRHPYFGSTVGRFCNRIAKGKFSLNGQEYTLAANNDPNHLHGGEKGFDKQVWDVETVKRDDAVGIRFLRISKDGEEGYPGNVSVVATYLLDDRNELTMTFEATTDKPTPINLTNHCYWNLAGAGSGKMLDQELTIMADQYLEIDETMIPTGKLVSAKGTALDFSEPHTIGERIADMKGEPGGYDHCYALRSQDGSLKLAAKVKDPKSGRVMEILTTQPGLQLYSGNFLDGTEDGGGNNKHDAFCLETQHYPDAPNQQAFKSTTLNPGQAYKQTTVHRFSVSK